MKALNVRSNGFGWRVRWARDRARLTQEILAHRATISRPWLAKIEGGHVDPRLSDAIALHGVLVRELRDLSLEWLLTGGDADPSELVPAHASGPSGPTYDRVGAGAPLSQAPKETPSERRTFALGSVGLIAWTTAAADPVIQAIDRLCRLVGLTGETVDSLEGTVSDIALSYTRRHPAELQPQVQQLLVYVEQLLEAYPHSKHRLRLQVASGWLSGLVARAFDDLGDLPAAAANARTALALGRLIGDHKLTAWACNLQGGVWFRLENPGQALKWAQQGVAVAPPGTAQRVRLLGWQAIVQARLGQREAVLATLDTAQREFDRLPPTEFVDGLLGIGPIHMPSCISTATRWLDLPGTTLHNAELVIDAERRQPRSPARLALARLDLAAALAQLGKPDEAIGHAAAALSTERLTSTIVQRAEHLDGLLTQRWPDEAIVREFHEQRLALSPPAPPSPAPS